MEKELSLLEVYNWAIRLKDWTEFKSAIDEFYNKTPRSAKDESTYKLVKNNGVLDDVSNCGCIKIENGIRMCSNCIKTTFLKDYD